MKNKLLLPFLLLSLALLLPSLNSQAQSGIAKMDFPTISTGARPDDFNSMLTWSRLVYVSTQDGNNEIYFSHADGSQALRLTNHPANDSNPSLNRGATQVVFQSTRDHSQPEIYKMNTDGSGLTRLTTNTLSDTEPVFSPDGSKIVFARASRIYVMNADGANQVRLTNSVDSESGPSWSPDGSKIVFLRTIQKNGKGSMWVMDSNGANAQQINPGILMWPGRARWSPDGKKIAYEANNDYDDESEVGFVDLETGYFWVAYDAKQTGVNITIGNWAPDSVWLGIVRSEPSGNSYLEAHEIVFAEQHHARLTTLGKEIQFYWQTADITPPVSFIHPLPEYSRASGYPVVLEGYDTGPSPLSYSEIHYRNNYEPPWWNGGLMLFTGLENLTFWGDPGTKVFIRSRAADEAGNWEALPASPDGETSTTLYTYRLDGSVSDARGRPVIHMPVSLNPLPINTLLTDVFGNFTAWMKTVGAHTLNPTHPAYGAFLPLNLQIDHDMYQSRYLPPINNLLVNSEFENGISGWQPGGDTPARLETVNFRSGAGAAFFGIDCIGPCLKAENRPGNSGHWWDLYVEPDGTAHVVHHTYNSLPRLIYQFRTPQGVWSPEEDIPFDGILPCIAVTPDHTVHVVSVVNYDLYYQQKPVGGVWSDPVWIGPGSSYNTDCAADSLGNFFVVDRDVLPDGGYLGLYYLERTPEGVWITHPNLTNGASMECPKIVVGQDNRVHFAWEGYSKGVYYRIRYPDGSLGPIELAYKYLESGNGQTQLHLAVDPAGTAYIFFRFPRENKFISRPINGSWSLPEPNVVDPFYMATAADSHNTLHIFYVEDYDLVTRRIIYLQHSSNGNWSNPEVFLPGSWWNIIAGIDAQDNLHLLTTGPENNFLIRYHSQQIAEQPGASTLSQSLVIPPDAHKPTFSGMYRLFNLSDPAQTSFVITVTNALTSTQIYTAPSTTGWGQFWVDLQAWAGQTVTLTLGINQAAGEKPAHLVVDELSFGDWLTPVIHSAAPLASFAPSSSLSVLIHGENFIALPQVRLNDQIIEQVQYIDEHTLLLTLPAGLPPGLYDVWVANPGGQTGFLLRGLSVGYPLYLPLLTRQP